MAESEPVSTEAVAATFEGADEAAGDATEFTPKVEVDKVEVKTLEEDEEVCFKMRSKLFVFVAEDVYGGEVRKNWWRERGTGDVKLLKHKQMGKVRLLMRQEKTLKICANHLVSPYVELKPNVGSDRSWVFTASDFADEEVKTETFAIKFANSETAEAFKEKLELAKAINGGTKPAEAMTAVADDDDEGAPAPAASSEKAAIDKQIEERNKREEATVGDPTSAAADKLAEGVAGMSLPGEGMPGGFSATDASSEEVQAAAKFAAEQIGKGDLVKVTEAAQQVVAGINFHLKLHIKHSDDAVHGYTAKVFKPLPHTNEPMQLSESEHTGAV